MAEPPFFGSWQVQPISRMGKMSLEGHVVVGMWVLVLADPGDQLADVGLERLDAGRAEREQPEESARTPERVMNVAGFHWSASTGSW